MNFFWSHTKWLLMALSVMGCGSDVTGLDEEASCAVRPDSTIATFSDPNLELAVRSELSTSPLSDLTCGMLANVTDLTAANAGIVSIGGLENLVNLETLQIRANDITDIGPLRTLTQLTSLNLADNSISNVSPLSGLTNLTFLAINQNSSITDVSPLGGLINLTGTLWMGENAITDLNSLGQLAGLTAINAWDNQITDISGLTALTGLTAVRLHINQITDVSALRGLTGLTQVSLHTNPGLSDIQPLLENGGLANGASVNLHGTGVSCADLAALRAHGASVISDCP